MRTWIASAALLTTATVTLAGAPAQKNKLPVVEAKSAALAKALVPLIAARGNSYAARDPSESGRYVAALWVPGVELLVISAKADANALEYALYQKDYKGAYADLTSGISSQEKVFVEDIGGNGLMVAPDKDTAADTFTRGQDAWTFDGDLKKDKDKLTVDEYMKRFTEADAVYAKMLEALRDAIK